MADDLYLPLDAQDVQTAGSKHEGAMKVDKDANYRDPICIMVTWVRVFGTYGPCWANQNQRLVSN